MQGGPLSHALEGLRARSPEVKGAVLATREGLVLAASGTLTTDTAAASGTHMADQVDRCLSLLAEEACGELLIWTEATLWCLVRLAGGCTLLVSAGRECQAGALRMATRRTGDLLSPLLRRMHAQEPAAQAASPRYYAPG
jgi:predicted regulator of Ras-like GTPase activity (Roadblock/LC7/MglB family)